MKITSKPQFFLQLFNQKMVLEFDWQRKAGFRMTPHPHPHPNPHPLRGERGIFHFVKEPGKGRLHQKTRPLRVRFSFFFENLKTSFRYSQKKEPPVGGFFWWRREGDSNPRTSCEINGFRDRPDRPLWHLSEVSVGLGVGVGVASLSNSHPNTHPPRGERGIRTPGGLHLNGFQDRRNRPLCHLSVGKSTNYFR